VRFAGSLVREVLALREGRAVSLLTGTILFGIASAAVLLAPDMLKTGDSGRRVGSLACVGLSIGFFKWCCERLVRGIMRPVVGETHAGLMAVVWAGCWFMSGGMGFTTGVLIVKRLHLLPVQDVPVAALFLSGAELVLALQIVLNAADWGAERRFWRKR
jgi:hypothetical protein